MKNKRAVNNTSVTESLARIMKRSSYMEVKGGFRDNIL